MNILLPKILSHFLLSLSLGTALFSWIASSSLTGAGFIRLITGHGFIFLALGLILDFIFSQHMDILVTALSVCALISVALQWKFHKDHKSSLMWALYSLQLLATIGIYFYQSTDPRAFLIMLSSGLLLGITHYSMLLGHYYLVVPKLTERPLLVSLKIFWVLLCVKLMASGMGTYKAWPYLSEGTQLGDGYVFNWLIISMRWLWGYLALAILSGFSWKLCRMRSIQSATGVLYIMVFFVFIGELLSIYLYFKHGLSI
ncbi:MAG: hypothetical protein K2P81_15325 [Bacteriovoracaceae bacterium]|nr:hypothetical protein [Bacteriovoracaceae bacterium]